MIKRDQLKKFLDEYFGQELIDKARKKDEHMPNGLQWSGKERVKKLVLGVSVSEDFLTEAVKSGADAVLVHHGLSQNTPYNLYAQSLQKRLKILTKNNLSLWGYHYILDVHPQIGNNAVIIKKLGAQKTDTSVFDEWGWVGEFKKKEKVSDLVDKCTEIFSHDVFMVKSGERLVKRIGVVSGRGVGHAQENSELVEKNIQVYITGEISEWIPAQFKEMGITYLACGHYATEVFGVQELGKVIKEEFKDKLKVEFIEIPNPL